MRISSINVAQPVKLNYTKRTKNVQTQPVQTQQPAFKGWKGGLGSVVGTILGGAAGIALTGGIGVIPFILAGTGAITGGEYGKSKENNGHDDYSNYDAFYPNSN